LRRGKREFAKLQRSVQVCKTLTAKGEVGHGEA
jgi:hypothetical protein